MKVALLGAGKTGGKVVELLPEQPTVFDESNPPTVEKLAGHDVIIVFVPGDALVEHIDVLIDSKIPVVTGATGVNWPDDINERLQSRSVAWITTSNFAVGMNVVKILIQNLALSSKIIDDASYHLHETHHITKKDVPSGTALSWEKWLAHPVEFTDDRRGDVVGEHRLTMQSEFEDISVEHIAKDRKVFASGAIWTAHRILKGDLQPGLHYLDELMKKELGL